jgi:chromosome segregation ATPase
MYEQINKQIAETREHLRKKDKIQGMLRQAEETLYREEERLGRLKEALDKEEADVRKLEGLSIRGIFFSIVGNKQERLSKEEEEFLSAKLKYDECSNSVSVLREEVERYSSQVRGLGNAQFSLEDLLKRKEEIIINSKDQNAREILNNLEQISILNLDLQELREAMMAGNDVIRLLEEAMKSLDEAEGWGQWDMFGGGFLSTSAKHSSIDDAVEYVTDAKSQLNRFSRELKDVNMNIDINIDISSFDRFADYFFDGLIADWNVQNKIGQSLDSVNDALNRVRLIVGSVQSRYNELEGKVHNLRQKNRTIVENTTDDAGEIKYIGE